MAPSLAVASAASSSSSSAPAVAGRCSDAILVGGPCHPIGVGVQQNALGSRCTRPLPTATASSALAFAAAGAAVLCGRRRLREVSGRGGRLPSRVSVAAVVEDDSHAVAVRRWVKDVIVGHDFCPWAGPADSSGRIRVATSAAATAVEALADLVEEARRLPEEVIAEALPPGVATTTLLSFPSVKDFADIRSFDEFYKRTLREGFLFAKVGLFIVSFHPRFGSADSAIPKVANGDIINLGNEENPMPARVVDVNAGYGEYGQSLAQVQIVSTGKETYIVLPEDGEDSDDEGEGTKLVNRAPRPMLHLLRMPDLDAVSDAGLRARNCKHVQALGGEAGVDALVRQCG